MHRVGGVDRNRRPLRDRAGDGRIEGVPAATLERSRLDTLAELDANRSARALDAPLVTERQRALPREQPLLLPVEPVDPRTPSRPETRSRGPSAAACTEARTIDLLPAIRERVYSRSLPLATSDLAIVASSLHPREGLVGLAHLVSDGILEPAQIGRLIDRDRNP